MTPYPDEAAQEIAELYHALNDVENAKKYALRAHKWACADGEPYVRRYDLNKTTKLLEELGETVPELPVYDPGKDKLEPWQKKVLKAIEELEAEKSREK